MALDRQRILGELGSVMKQLQSADCGCLGKLFNSQQVAPPTMGSPLPTCGGCRRSCCHGHGYGQYNQPTPINQPVPNMNYMSTECPNSSQQPVSGNMFGFGPQIVNMMKGDNNRPQNMSGQGHLQGPLTGPMVIDAPQSPHGKVGLTPFTPPSMGQQGQFNPDIMNRGDVTRQMQNQFIPQSNTNTGNPLPQQNVNANQMSTPQMNSWPQQNINANQMSTPQMNSWPQQSMASNPTTLQSSVPNSNPHGQHTEGIAKFNKMFPGVKQGMGGDLGFDPMAIAIQMNPDNHLQSAMDTMNNIMSGNKGMNQMFNKTPTPQPGDMGNSMNQIPPAINRSLQQNAVPDQVAPNNTNQVSNQQPIGHNLPNEGTPYQQHTYANANGQPIPQLNQQIYAATIDPNSINQEMWNKDNQQLVDHRHQQMMNLHPAAPNLPVIQDEEKAEDNQLVAPTFESNGYPNQVPMQKMLKTNQEPVQQMIKEPIFPADTSKNIIYMPTKQQRINNYGYNTLGQPVEMLPAKNYHPPEPSLPQTLSPQPNPVKQRSNLMLAANVKATVSKTSLMGNRQAGKTPSRAQLQHIYNKYKGSQSFTQQNVRQPGAATCSDGQLNVPQVTKAPSVPVERVGGDTVVNNQPNNQDRTNKIEQVIGQIGDVAAAKPAGDNLPLQEAPATVRKSRNGLQDMVFSAYPTSAAWTFHGHGRNDRLQPQRFGRRRY